MLINAGVAQPPILWFLGVLFAIPIASAAPGLFWPGFYSQHERRSLPLRVRSWLMMVAIFAVSLALGPTPALVFIGFVSFLALKAYLSFAPTRRADRPILLLAYAAIPIQYTLIGYDRYRLFVTFVPVIMLLVITMAILAREERRGYLAALGTIHLGLMLSVFSLSHMAYLLLMPHDVNPGLGGAGLVVFLAVVCQLTDVIRHLIDRLSVHDDRAVRGPVKPSRDGALGGISAAVVLALVTFGWLTPFTPLQALGAGLLIGTGTVMGNAIMTVIREELRLRDTSTLLPGQGGVLDRLGSLMLSAPFFFYYLVTLWGGTGV